MEALLGFEEEDTTTIVENKSCGYKLVPWLSWDEWDIVRESLFSSSPLSLASSLSRISAWRSRGCLPVVVDVTASIVEIQQKDPFFRVDDTNNNLHSEDMLAMLYCMAITRLVNGVVEKTRKKTEISIAEAADAIGIPRMLIDIRHEGSHRDLPSLRLLRLASVKALDWLKSYYWEPQQKEIVFQRDGTAHIRKEINSKLNELVFCLKAKQRARSSSSLVKEKGSDSKKQITKMMKTLVRLYSSFSSEVVSVLLECMLKASDALDLVENPKNSQVGSSIDNSLNVTDEWKLVTTKLSNKEPKLLPTLLKAVLDMIETQKAVEYKIGNKQLISLENKSEDRQVELFSSLFAWLVRILKVLKPSRRKCSSAENEDCSADTLESSATMVELMRRALLVSDPGNEQLMESVLNLARMTGNRSLIEKLNKLSLITSPYTYVTEQNPPLMPMKSENLHIQQEDYIRQAAEKLEVLKLKRIQRKSAMTIECKGGKSNRWVIAKSWNRCAIGMLPRAIGSSGRLPVLDSCDDNCKGVIEPLESKESRELNRCGKKEATCDIEMLDNSIGKKMRETVEECEMIGDDAILDGVEGQLMIDGVWRKVEETELLAIRSAIKIFPLPESSETPTGDATGGGRAVTKARKRKAFKERSDTPTGDAAGGARAVANAPKKAAKKQKKKAQGDSDTPTGDATGGGADTPTGGATGGGSDTPISDATGGGSDTPISDATGGGLDTPTGDATEGGRAVSKARKRKAYKEERKKKARMAQL